MDSKHSRQRIQIAGDKWLESRRLWADFYRRSGKARNNQANFLPRLLRRNSNKHWMFMSCEKQNSRRAGCSPVNLATPLNVMSSIITGSERPFWLTANRINRYELVASTLSRTNDTGGLCEVRRASSVPEEKKLNENFEFDKWISMNKFIWNNFCGERMCPRRIERIWKTRLSCCCSEQIFSPRRSTEQTTNARKNCPNKLFRVFGK